jgi:esterase/lipase superfamily enzyme
MLEAEMGMTEKLYRVTYVGNEVVNLGRAGKFMPGTVAFLDEEGARVAAGRADFEVAGLAGASAPVVEAQPAAPPPKAAEPPPPPKAAEPPPPPKAAEPPPPKAAEPPAPPPKAAEPELARHSVGWRSERTQCDTRLLRWGHAGRAVLWLSPDGGDAELAEREQLVAALRPLLDAGKLKLYSVDDVAGRALSKEDGAPEQRMRLLGQFHEYLALEVVPAMRSDGAAEPAIAAGAGLGALHAAALLVRHPELFSHALCASGVFKPAPLPEAVPPLPDGPQLEQLRGRFLVCATGEEDPAESFALAAALGDKGVPNRVDPWGAAAGRGWAAWRAMVPKYLAEWLA